jgi:hypothetical protein
MRHRVLRPYLVRFSKGFGVFCEFLVVCILEEISDEVSIPSSNSESLVIDAYFVPKLLLQPSKEPIPFDADA